MTHDHRLPIRRELNHARRVQLAADDHALRAQLAELDRRAVLFAAERRALVDRLRHIHDRLWRAQHHAYGRLPPRPNHPPLPPTHDEPHGLLGRALRTVCLAILYRHGELALPEIHALLHVYGYEVYGANPGKALADAMRYEVLEGRATRPHRGRYAAAQHAPPKPRRHEPELPPIDPFLLWAPDRWWPSANHRRTAA